MTALRAPRFDTTQQLLDLLANDIRTQRLITAATLQSHMIAGFGDSDASGAWSWRQAYDLCEAALLIAAEDLAAVSNSPEARLIAFEAAQGRLPTQSRRGEDQVRLQQFSTPLPYAFIAAVAANIRAGETLLEPSAGVGALAKMGQLFGGKLLANEIDAPRRDLLGRVLGLVPTAHNAEHIDDLLPPNLRPSVILMNPPFVSSSTRADPAMAERHLYAAFKRLAPGGRLVAILPTSFTEASVWWAKMKDRAIWRLRLQVPGAAFRKHGTSVETLLCVFDKLAPTGGGAEFTHRADSLAEALQVLDMLPPRASLTALAPSLASPLTGLTRAAAAPRPQALVPQPLVYHPRAQAQFGEPVSPVFAAYVPQRVDIPGAQPHPTDLVESLAMASVLPPLPTYQPLLPTRLVEKGLLSVAQLETVIHAGEAHRLYLPGLWARDGSETAFIEAASGGVKVRQGFFLGDGTGAGKGRQGAAIILDNFLQGRRLAVWISKSTLLIEG